MEEMRIDRKIKMILKDKGIEEYIRLDITDIDLDNCVGKDLSEFPEEVKIAIVDKLVFRRNLALKASITKLNYYAKMLQKVFGSSHIPLPENYTDKLKQL